MRNTVLHCILNPAYNRHVADFVSCVLACCDIMAP